MKTRLLALSLLTLTVCALAQKVNVLDGYSWSHFTFQERILWTQGFFAAVNEMQERSSCPKSASMFWPFTSSCATCPRSPLRAIDVVGQINRFYDDTNNLDIPVSSVPSLLWARSVGMNEKKIDGQIFSLRQKYSR